MPLRLSAPERNASVEISESLASFQVVSEMSTPFQARETITYGSGIGKEFPGFEWLASRLLIFGESVPEDQTALRSAQENGKSEIFEIGIPKLEWPARADPILTSSVRKLLGALWAIVVSRAMQVRFPLRATVVSTFDDPSEQKRKAVLRLACSANAVQALAFWDSLEPDLRDWLATLSEYDRTTFITKLGLRVHWR